MQPVRTVWKPLLLFASIFAAAYVARVLIVPNVAPIAEGTQSIWPIQVAFLLTSVQNIGLFGMASSYWRRCQASLESLSHDESTLKTGAISDRLFLRSSGAS
jgi:hypothetical protein